MPSVTISDALNAAHAYWEAKGPSSRMMPIRANACAKALGMTTPLSKLTAKDGFRVLQHLRSTGKSKGSVASYYAAFKRAVEIGGGRCHDWPKADTPPRRTREPLSEEDLDRLAHELEGYSHTYGGTAEDIQLYRLHVLKRIDGSTFLVRGLGWETYDLLELLRGTGSTGRAGGAQWGGSTLGPQGEAPPRHGEGAGTSG
jgi:hypothetical protein